MVCFWLMEIMPLAVTALIPVVFLPLFGILSTDETCTIYMKEINMIFLGSLIAATAVEYCNLHNRLALRILLFIGTSPRWLMLGFMLTTMFLSMWISNTAATALMVPILNAVLYEMQKSTDPVEEKDKDVSVISVEKLRVRKFSMASVITDPIEEDSRSKEEKNLRKALFMGICYSANIGGTGTLTGTTPNLILKGQMDNDFNDYSRLTFASWMLFNIPGTILCVILAWAWLQILFMRQCGKDEKSSSDSVKKLIEGNYRDLGSITFHEAAVLVLFIVLIILWFCRDPGFMPGWGVALSGEENKAYLKDAIPAIAIVLLLFVIPARPRELETSPPLLEWKIAQQNVPWGVILLLGGGFALAEGTTRSGLSFWLGEQLTVLKALSAEVVILIVCLFALTLTEVASNTATATIMMPVLSNLADAVGIHPIKIMMPVAMCCSYAFILPVATAPNAIVFEAAPLTQREMALPGFVMKLLCLSISMLMIHTIGNPIFEMDVPINTNSTLDYEIVLR
ncbi:Na(+)/citrate cotransporter-like isoform X2 [Tachypleus tridentatus]